LVFARAQADGADEQAYRPLLPGEDMLNRRAHRRLAGIGRAVRRGIGVPLGFCDGSTSAGPGRRGTADWPLCGRRCRALVGGIVAVEHRAELAAIMHRRMGDGVAA
jgi:hypothetical protein